MKEQVLQISVDKLSGFHNHPYQVKNDESLRTLCESIEQYGVLSPLLARPVGDGYEIVSGHRRKAAALRLGLDKLPVLVREMTDDEAVILMVDSNIQRENLLPSEKAFAYKMKLEAIRRQAGRLKSNSPQVAANLRSDDEIGEKEGISGDTVRRYIRLKAACLETFCAQKPSGQGFYMAKVKTGFYLRKSARAHLNKP